MFVDHLLKKKERIQKFKETGDTKCIYRNELDKASFQHYMAYGDFKDLAKSTSDYLQTYRSQLLKNIKKEEFILHLETIFRVLI